MAEEKQFENRIKSWLDSKEIWYVKYFANRNTKVGIPDILACVSGHFVAIEVKASNGKPSSLQLMNRKKIRDANGIAVILYPDQFEKFKMFIEDIIADEDAYETLHASQVGFDFRK